MKKNLQLMTAFVLASLVALPMSAAAYIKFEGVNSPAKDAKHNGTIEISSYSFGATAAAANGNVVAGNRIGTDATGCTTGPLKFQVKGTPSPELAQLCQARSRVTSLVVVFDGVQHTLQNASFASCQTGNGSVPTDQFTMNFEKCLTHGTTVQSGATLQVQSAAAPRPNAKLIGLNPTPTQVVAESLTLNGPGRATLTLTKVGQGTLILSSGAHQKLPSLTLELTNGQKWTFYEVVMEDLLISSATGQRSADHPTDTFSLNFTKVEGPASGFQLRK